jgi:hypothetical protein
MRRPFILLALLICTLPLAAEDPDLAGPSAEHKRLTTLAGDWNVVARWTLDAANPIEESGQSRIRTILGGRFVQINTKSSGPMSSESLTILGFDRRSRQYTFVGFDTDGTYYVTASGPWDEQAKEIVMAGADADPVAKSIQKFRVRLRPVSANELRLAISFFASDGKEITVVESTYTRSK